MARLARQLHRANAVVITAFIAMHLGNHLTAWGGIAAHRTAMESLRAVYRNAYAEPVLITVLVIQIAAGMALLRHQSASDRIGFWAKTQRISGITLAIFLIMHTGAALSARWLAGVDTNFYWPAGTLVLAPLKFWFLPYYLVALIAFAAHISSALHFNGWRKTSWTMLAIGPFAALIVVLPFTGALYAIELPQAHQDYFESYFPVW